MKKITWIVLTAFLLLSGCATYESSYSAYSVAQSMIAQASGPIVTFHPNGQLASVGNPMVPLMGMQMKGPKSDWDGFWDVLRAAIPMGAIWGIVGAMSTANHGATTNVSGEGNFVGNTASGGTSWASPPSTTNNTTTNSTSNAMLPDGLVAE